MDAITISLAGFSAFDRQLDLTKHTCVGLMKAGASLVTSVAGWHFRPANPLIAPC
jgi:hypothetical protein